MQADFVTPSVLGVASHHKSGHRLNGVIPRMNITPNPLAQEADKVCTNGCHDFILSFLKSRTFN